MAEKRKHDLQYLYNAYKKHYNKSDMYKANKYNDLSIKLHGSALRDRYHAKLAKKEENQGPFGIGKTKRLRYG